MTDHLPDEQCKGLLANATVRWADDMPLDLTPWRNPLTTQSVPAHGANIGAPVPARVENASGSVGLPWFCFYTEPREEKQAFDGIVALGFAALFFRFLSFRRHYGRMEPMVKTLFPRYVLASFDPDADAWGPILQVRGVRCVLAAPSGRPVQLRPGEVERLQALGRAADGVICEGLPGMVPVQPAQIEPGQRVRVSAGPMIDWSGVCEWSEDYRVGILMTMFGAQRVVEMDRRDVMVA